MSQAVFAIPGDKDRRTGGFIYEARVLNTLNKIGCPTEHLQLPASFPDPSAVDMQVTLDALRDIPTERPVILDGLVFGAIDPDGLAQVKAPVIAMIHHPLGLETGLPARRAAFLRQNEAAAISHTTHIIVPSAETARVLCQDFGADPDRITCAPPGFDRPHVAPVPARPPLILSVGLLAPRKGHDVLLSALAEIRELHWCAEIVGKTHDTDYAQALERQCCDLDLSERVTFTGELGDAALARRMNAATVFALATRYEGYGMVLNEAMFYGLPIVTCDAGAVSATVGEAAALVPPDDHGAFARALETLLSDPDRAKTLARAARARSEQLPTWEDTARIFEDVIGRVASTGRNCPR